MMKSFFKKLAFVMALAMVVTMAAPAGKAALAASFYISKQENKEEVTNFNLAVGAEQDFRYIGATDYTKYNFAWKSDKTDIATVDKNGVVKGVKDGVAVVTCTGTSKADGKTVGYTASMVVTVGKGDAPIASTSDYVVKQDTATTVKILFNDATEYTVEDFELFYVIDGGWTISWPIKSVNPAKDAAGNVIDGQYILEPYVEFTDGDKYILKVDGEEEGTEFVTSFGTLTHLEIHYTCNGVTDGNAVVNTVDSKDVYEVQCSVKFFAGDVDVTSLYDGEQDEVEYQMKSSNESDIKFKKDGEITFKKTGIAAVVSASYEFKDKVTNEKRTVYSIKAVPIVSVPLPEYNLTLVDWAIVDEQNTANYDKINWNAKAIRANDDSDDNTNYIIVAKFTDSFGKNFINFDKYLPKNADGTVKDGWYGPNTAKTTFDKGDYSLQYSSANNDKLLIGKDNAKITTHTEADVAVIVGLYSKDKDIAKKDTGFVKNVAAFTVEVTEERYIDAIDLSEDDIELPNDAVNNKSTFTEKTVKLYILDQYGEPWKYELDTTKDYDFDFKSESDTDGVSLGDFKYVPGTDKNYAAITLNGTTIHNKTKGDTVTFTITVADETIDLEVTTEDVYKTKQNESDPNVVDYDETPELAVKDVELAVDKLDYLPRTASIALTYVNGDLAVGYAEKVALYNDVTVADDGKETFPAINGEAVTAGQYYLAVYAPDGSLVQKASTEKVYAAGSTTEVTEIKPTSRGVYQLVDGTFALCAGIDEGANKVMDYLKTGEYKVELRIAEYDEDEKCLVTDDEEEATITVSNNNYALEFVSLRNVETEEDTLKDIINELVVVSVNGTEWKFDHDADILKVEGRYNEKAGQIIIKKIWFNVALNASGKGDVDMGYEASVEINRAIEVKKGFKDAFNNEGICTNLK